MNMGLEQQRRNEKHIEQLEDTANIKASIIQNASEIVTQLGHKEKFALKKEEIDLMCAMLNKNILYSEKNDVKELEAVASQAVNQALRTLGEEKPGFTNEFVDALKLRLIIH